MYSLPPLSAGPPPKAVADEGRTSAPPGLADMGRRTGKAAPRTGMGQGKKKEEEEEEEEEEPLSPELVYRKISAKDLGL